MIAGQSINLDGLVFLLPVDLVEIGVVGHSLIEQIAGNNQDFDTPLDQLIEDVLKCLIALGVIFDFRQVAIGGDGDFHS